MILNEEQIWAIKQRAYTGKVWKNKFYILNSYTKVNFAIRVFLDTKHVCLELYHYKPSVLFLLLLLLLDR